MPGDGFIENDVPREEEFSIEVAYQPSKAVLNIANENSFKASSSSFATDLLRLVDEALTAKYA